MTEPRTLEHAMREASAGSLGCRALRVEGFRDA